MIVEWLLSNTTELLGAILGIVYIFFSIRQNILTWPTGLLTSILYVIVFFQAKLYADMGLQVYYVFISIYGWYFWLKGKKPKESEQTMDLVFIFSDIIPHHFVCFNKLHRFRCSLHGFADNSSEYCCYLDAGKKVYWSLADLGFRGCSFSRVVYL